MEDIFLWGILVLETYFIAIAIAIAIAEEEVFFDSMNPH